MIIRSALRPRVNLAFSIEICALLTTAPIFLFSTRFDPWWILISSGVLITSLVVRRRIMRCWWNSTPADWSLAFLLLVMLPISIWMAPDSLRMQISVPRLIVLVWSVWLFSVVVVYGSSRLASLQVLLIAFIVSVTLVATIAPLGMNWLYKFPLLDPVLSRIPSPLQGIFAGAESGFSPNQVAGMILLALPLAIAILVDLTQRQPLHGWWWLIASMTMIMLLVLVLTQSRSGLLGFVCGLFAMFIFLQRRGRWLAVVAVAIFLLLIPWLGPRLFGLLKDADTFGNPGGSLAMNSRIEIWTNALYSIHDFPLTGIGLGTFREIVRYIYPLYSIPAYFDIAHAHNFFIQTALDLGIPGLAAMLAIYLAACVQIVQLWSGTPRFIPNGGAFPWDVLAIGFTGSLVAQTIYSQFDALALGAKPGFLFWYLIALIFATGNLRLNPSTKVG